MQFKLTHPLPKKCLVAVSGGVDSMVALHWLSQKEGRVRGVVHFHHGTGDFADQAHTAVKDYVRDLGLDFPVHTRYLNSPADPGHSLENHFRDQRYRWFKEVSAVNNNLPVVVAHNMDDCLEEYVMCTMVRGFSGTIPYAHDPCIRPFRLWKREDIEHYARDNGVKFLNDPSNLDVRFKRNHIRHEVSPRLKELNPGIYKVVESIVRKQDERDGFVATGYTE